MKRAGKIFGEARKRHSEGGAPPDHHIVAAGRKAGSGRKPHDFLEPPAYPVALDGAAYSPRNGKTNPCRSLVAAPALLHDKPRGRNAGTGGGGKKIPPVPQSFHWPEIREPAQPGITR